MLNFLVLLVGFFFFSFNIISLKIIPLGIFPPQERILKYKMEFEPKTVVPKH